MQFDALFREQTPVTPKRGVHLDLKGVPPTAKRLVQLIEVFAAARYNVVLVEWEDSFPWTVDERFRSPTAYTPDDVRAFCKTAASLGIELIPLVQCLGHMETPLAVAGYERLREVPNDSSVLNALAPGARELVQNMVNDVLQLMPDITYFHLGGDEARTMGHHPDTKAYLQKHGKGALYLHHVEPILEDLNARGVRPLLWHDMMIDWNDAALDSLAQKADLVTWGYAEDPVTTDHHYNIKYIERFHEHGVRQWGGTAYKGADGHNIDLPDIANRQANALAWIRVAQQFDFAGVIATAWSRYSTNRVQCEPIDAALDSLINVAVILHDGQPPKGGIEACVTALEELEERARFEACRAAMAHLSAFRRRTWQEIQSVREQVVLCRNDPRRGHAPHETDWIERLRQSVMEKAEDASVEMKRSFHGLLDPVWIEEYLETRLAPLREDLESLG